MSAAGGRWASRGCAGGRLLEDVVDRATVVLCALKCLGGMSQAFDLTIEYLKTRDQFGVKIGSFSGAEASRRSRSIWRSSWRARA